MKTNTLRLCVPALLLAGVIAALNFGCGKTSPTEESKPASASKYPSVSKNSFSEITSQLDPGGDFYLYLGTAQWLEGLSAKVNSWRGAVTSLPDLKPEDTANVNKMFDIVTRLISDSGVEDITGLGLSSVEVESGMFRNKAVTHHYPGKGTGFLWQFCGGKPHALAGLDLLPTDTALATFSDLDLQSFWAAVQKEVTAADIPQATQFLQMLPAQFEQQTHVKWDDFVKSLGGEFGFVLTLDDNATLSLPIPGFAVQVPTPGLMLAVKVNDDTIFNLIDQQLKANEQVIASDKPGLKLRTLPVPIPFVGQFRPSAASSGGYLLIASSDDLINSALAVKAGQKPGLKAGEEFKRLAKGLPEQGNQFMFMSTRFAGTLLKVQQQIFAANAGNDAKKAQLLQTLFSSKPAFGYTVGANTPEGSVSVGNTSESYSKVALLPALVVPGMLAAIAVPNFVKARATAQANACINNLRQLDAAENQFALEKGKKTGDPCTMNDLLPYLRGPLKCPAGGTYTIHPVGESPTCSLEGQGHAMQ